MYGGDKTLLDIFRLGLQSDYPDLRDAIVTYIAIENYADALHVLESYTNTETLPWLKEYALKVVAHIRKTLRGDESYPPEALDEDTQVMVSKKSLKLRWQSRYPDSEGS